MPNRVIKESIRTSPNFNELDVLILTFTKLINWLLEKHPEINAEFLEYVNNERIKKEQNYAK